MELAIIWHPRSSFKELSKVNVTGQYLQGGLQIFMHNLNAMCLSAWRYCHEAKGEQQQKGGLPEI